MKNNLLTKAQVREIDRSLIEEHGIPGITLMRRAASACCDELLKRWPNPPRVRVYCGSGNNAADGYIVAGMLAEQNIHVDVVEIGDAKKLGSDGQMAYQYCRESNANMCAPDANLSEPTVVVDALLGTGFKHPLRPEYQKTIGAINQLGAPVLAVDVASGLDVDTGCVPDVAVSANVTVTFIASKRGLKTGDGVEVTGELVFASLVSENLPDAPPKSLQGQGEVACLSLSNLLERLPDRPRNAHKNRFGHVLVIGGDEGMGGAPFMTACAAMRTGAGLVSLATWPDHASQILAQQPELMVRGITSLEDIQPLLSKANVIVLGPGLGQSEWSEMLFEAAIATDLPLVVDADALNLLAKKPVKRSNWVLTPHPGEANRLLGVPNVQKDRFQYVRALQDQYGGVAILKGAGTLVANETQLSLCPYGNPGMSTAGMGDVLCGVIGGLIAQFGDLTLGAELGVVLHSAAGDACVEKKGERGLLATDLLPEIRRLVNGL